MNGKAAVEQAPQLDALTGLRGLAAWWVVFYHLRLSLTDLLPSQAISALTSGHLAVDLFFLLSGFVMWLNYGARFASGGLAQAPGFWWRRFARVWPLHAVILTGLLPFALIVHLSGRDGEAYPVGELPLHFLLVQNWGLTSELTWNHPAWSISAEVAAYLLFPLLALLLGGPRWSVGGLLAMLGALAALLHAVFASSGHSSLGDAIPQLGVWRCLAQFAMGIVLCQLWRRWRGRPGARHGAFAMFALLIAARGAGLTETAVMPLAFSALLLALALDKGAVASVLGGRGLRALGDISYATYLAHVPLLVLIKLLFVGDDLQLSAAILALYVVLLLAASAALYRLVEKPAQSWLRRHPPLVAFRLRKAA
jgi:peptidoglycan/LPS O-acetylase OafA/YrhL